MIYIVDARNNIGHPTRKHDMVGRLIRRGRAKIVKHLNKEIMIVQILDKVFDESKTIDCEFRIGIDPGYANIGFAVFKIYNTTITKLFTGEAKLRTSKIKEGLDERRMYRKNRRYLSRKNINKRFGKGHAKFKHPIWRNRKKHSFQPTHRHLIDSHYNVLKKLLKLVPVSQIKIHMEYNKFDIHKITTPKVHSFYYQRGQQFGFDNVKAYVRNRDNYHCQICNEDVGQEPNEVHHIIWRSQVGSSDRPDNLILLCHECHNKVHKKGLVCPTKSSSVNNYRDAGVLNTVMKYLWNYFESNTVVQDTYGYITSGVRQQTGTPKTHANDASIIAFSDSLGLQDIQNYSWRNYTAELNMVQFPRHSRSFTLRHEDRKYIIKEYEDQSELIGRKKKKTFAWNRNRRDGQDPKKKSLTELKQDLIKAGKLNRLTIIAIPGKRVMKSSNNVYTIRKGDIVKVHDRVRVCQGVQNKGKVITFKSDSLTKKLDLVGVKHCQKLASNCGLVT